MKAFAISAASEAAVYPHLLDWARHHAAGFHLVLRHGLDFDAGALAVVEDLKPDTCRIRLTREWAGTTALDPARIIECRLTGRSIEVLQRANGIFEWCYPQKPEDLAFFAADGSCVFNSVAHHEEAWICDSTLKTWIEDRVSGALTESGFDTSEVTFDAGKNSSPI